VKSRAVRLMFDRVLKLMFEGRSMTQAAAMLKMEAAAGWPRPFIPGSKRTSRTRGDAQAMNSHDRAQTRSAGFMRSCPHVYGA
jgi:hypothetical protein